MNYMCCCRDCPIMTNRSFGNYMRKIDACCIFFAGGGNKISKSRANKQNRLRSQLRRQRNDVYKFKPKTFPGIAKAMAEQLAGRLGGHEDE